MRKVTSETPGPVSSLLLLPRPATLLQPAPPKVLPAPLQPFKKYRADLQGGGQSAI